MQQYNTYGSFTLTETDSSIESDSDSIPGGYISLQKRRMRTARPLTVVSVCMLGGGVVVVHIPPGKDHLPSDHVTYPIGVTPPPPPAELNRQMLVKT